MPNPKNLQQVEQLSNQLYQSEGVVLVDYKGLTHREIENLRNSIGEDGASFGVAKNTLTRIALQQTNPVVAEQINPHLAGPTAALFLGENIISPLKKLVELIKQHEFVKIKAGLLHHRYFSALQMMEIAKLPSYEQLMAQLIGQIQAP